MSDLKQEAECSNELTLKPSKEALAWQVPTVKFPGMGRNVYVLQELHL